MDCEPGVWRKERNQTITSFNTKLVVVWIGAGCGLDRVWIGLDPGLDRPGSGPTCLCMLQLGCSMTRKGRQGVQAASVQLGCLAGWPCNLQLCQLGSLTAWMRNSCSLAAGLLDCLAAWLYNSLSVGCLAGWITAEQETQKHATITGPNINSPIHYIIPKVWIKSFRMVWIGGLDQRSGSCVGPGLDPDLTFWAAARYVWQN